MHLMLAIALALLPVVASAQTHTKVVAPGVLEVSGQIRTIYVAGQIAVDKEGKSVGGKDMKAQAEQVFKNIEAALVAAGAKFSDVVNVTTYVTDMAQRAAITDVRARYFGDHRPPNTLVQVVSLVRPELLLEIQVVAAVREGR